ncbi:MAG TPA: glucosaminidase domain-containing protein [Acidimicrobiia bacterium]|nr:glucosaminidase domain-containing protein [Acidimicrobiia bacterium]
MRVRRAVLPLILLAMVVAPGAVASAATQDAAPGGDGAAVDAALNLQRIDDRLVLLDIRTHDADQDVLSATASLNVTEGLLTLNQARMDEVVKRVKERGVAAYTQHGAASAAPLDVERTIDVAAARQYAQSSTAVDIGDLGYLRAVDEKLRAEHDEKQAVHDGAVDELGRLRGERTALTAERADAIDRLNRLGAVPVMGVATLSAAQIAGWFRSTGASPALAPGTTIDDLSQLFIDEGADEGVRGDLAFAQAVIETGSFGVAAGNNYSGIGVCDSCSGGYAFVDPREGVRAQIQLLRNYADPTSRASNLAHPPSPSLYGNDPGKAARLYDTFFLKGKAPLWNLMGNGNWATDPVYAPKVIDLYARMVAWARGQAAAVPTS